MSKEAGPGTSGGARKRRKGTGRAAPRVSRHSRPEHLSPEEWQRALRRQAGEEAPFAVEKTGGERVFSEYLVANPASRRTYRVAIRGSEPGVNFCSCPDFATNLLGTCKHVESVLAGIRKKRGGTRALEGGFHPAHSSVTVVYGERRRVRLRLAAAAPAALSRRAARLFDREGWLAEEAFPGLRPFVAEAAAVSHDVRVYEDVWRLVEERAAAEARRLALDRAFPEGTASPVFETLLKTSLPPYQREGALFACRAGRSILADEMGLGKTIQAIAAAEIGSRFLGVEKVLVVCPASLKHQWQDEIGRFCGRTVEVVGGARRTRREIYSAPSFFKVTAYDTVHFDLPLIEAWAPQLVILDEAQRIKNWSTRVARSVKRIESPMALVLTGTPLENRLEELASIVQFVDRHRLGPAWRLRQEHQLVEEGTTRVVGYQNLDRLGETLAPVLLRRRKREVLPELPERTTKRLFVTLTPEQRDLHEENAMNAARIVAKWRRTKFLSDADQKRLTIALQNMRMVCDDVHLVEPKRRSGRKVDEVLTLLSDLLESEGTKAVVFSQWVRMHDLLGERLEAEGWGHVFLHGGVPSSNRGALVRQFRDDPQCRVFLSTDAGGTGLNLQAASVVVNVDLPWNPAVLEQRIGRVHRMGQRRSVQVFDFVAERSIEEGMLSLLGFKTSLFAGVLDGGDPKVLLGGSRLDRFRKGVESLTAPLAAGEAPTGPGAPSEPLPVPKAPGGAGEAIGNAPLPEKVETVATAGPPGDRSPTVSSPTVSGPAGLPQEALAGLFRAGASFLTQLAEAADALARGEKARSGNVSLDRDATDGQAVLTVRLGESDVFLAALRALTGGAGTS